MNFTFLREEQTAANLRKKEEREKLEEAENRKHSGFAATNGGEGQQEFGSVVEEQGQEAAAADPLAHLRVANDALAMRPTDLLSRRELVAHTILAIKRRWKTKFSICRRG